MILRLLPPLRNTLSTALLAAVAIALSGCLAGERPRISEMYPDPLAQAPVITAPSNPPGAPSDQAAAPQAVILEQNIEVRTIRPEASYGRQDRYFFPARGLRCDNAFGTCARWSADRRQWLVDESATRRYYGLPQQRTTTDRVIIYQTTPPQRP